MRAYLQGIGLYAPGLPAWTTSVPALCGEVAWQAAALPRMTLPLPPAERRRTSASARAAWAVAKQVLATSDLHAGTVHSVFVSSGGDGIILDQLCTALAAPGHAVSPTQFHNSVHNAPAGYYGIALHSHAPSTSLAAHPAPFAAGLLEAAVQVVAEACPVLLVGYDLIAPFPLAPVWPVQRDFAVALLLAPQSTATTLARLDINLDTQDTQPFSRASLPWQVDMAAANAMADSLQLLSAIATRQAAALRLPYLDGLALKVDLQCH